MRGTNNRSQLRTKLQPGRNGAKNRSHGPKKLDKCNSAKRALKEVASAFAWGAVQNSRTCEPTTMEYSKRQREAGKHQEAKVGRLVAPWEKLHFAERALVRRATERKMRGARSNRKYHKKKNRPVCRGRNVMIKRTEFTEHKVANNCNGAGWKLKVEEIFPQSMGIQS